MKNPLLLFPSGMGTLLVNCGTSDQTVVRIAAPTATTEVAERETSTRPTTTLAREQTPTCSFGSGVARTYQQKRERLRLLALAQNSERKNVRKGKDSTFFSSLFNPNRQVPAH